MVFGRGAECRPVATDGTHLDPDGPASELRARGWQRPRGRARKGRCPQGQLSPSAPPSAHPPPPGAPPQTVNPPTGRVGGHGGAPPHQPWSFLCNLRQPHMSRTRARCAAPQGQAPPPPAREQQLSPSARTQLLTHRATAQQSAQAQPMHPGGPESGPSHADMTDTRRRHPSDNGAGRSGRPQPLRRG